MRINRLVASFGKLEHEELKLKPGLNIIEAPNEAGKSTWSAFIRTMLYGLDTRERDSKTGLADKNLYRPWSGAPMEGLLHCEVDGRQITLRRETKGSVPMGSFSAVYTDTREPVPGLTGENAGLTLLGVEREVFVRSAMMHQTGLTVEQSPELERRIAALVTTGQETMAYSEVEARIREWQRKRRHNKSGLIPKLDEAQAQIAHKLEQLYEANAQIETATGEIARHAKKRDALLDELALHEQGEKRAQNRRLAQAKQELEQAIQAVDGIKKELTKNGAPPSRELLRYGQEQLTILQTMQANIQQAEAGEATTEAVDEPKENPRYKSFAGMSPEEAWQAAKADADAFEHAVKKAVGQPGRIILWLLFWLLAAVGVNYGLYWFARWTESIFWASLGGLSFCIIWVLILSASARRRAEKRVLEIGAKYDAAESDQILNCAASYREQVALDRQKRRQATARAEAAKELREKKADILRKLLAMAKPFAPNVADETDLGAAFHWGLTCFERLDAAIIRLEGAKKLYTSLLQAGGDPAGPTELVDTPARSRAEIQGDLQQVEAELSRQSQTLAMAQGAMRSMGEPALLMAEQSRLADLRARLQHQYDAIVLALDGLKEANIQMQARFSPRLNQRAGELMTTLTQGKYEKVVLDRAFQAEVEEKNGGLAHSALFLSRGTIDQLYLAIRLAICEMVLPKGVPLILDDALTNFDDIRMAAALKLLGTLAQTRQILLFTCHQREGACFSEELPACMIRIHG